MLKYKYGCDALAAGVEGNTRDTLMMLCAWAQKIIVVDKTLVDDIPLQHRAKTITYDVGPDLWFNPHQGLMLLFNTYIMKDPDFSSNI